MKTIATDSPFTEREQRALLAFAGAFLPASAEYDVPGADDPAIAADILAAAKRHAAAVVQALQLEDVKARSVFGADFADLDNLSRARCIEGANWAGFIDEVTLEKERFSSAEVARRTLASIIVQCYYRDDRVMRSLGMELRPPHPQGFAVEEGDWSLLEPVKRRGRIYREAAS